MVKEKLENNQNDVHEISPIKGVSTVGMNLEGGLSYQVLLSLNELNRRCQQAMGISSQEQINHLLISNRIAVGDYFAKLGLLGEQRVKNIIRFLDSCYEIGFAVNAKFCNFFLIKTIRKKVLEDLKN